MNKELIALAARTSWAQDEAERLRQELQIRLSPYLVDRKAPCGKTGWIVNEVYIDGRVNVRHACRYEHGGLEREQFIDTFDLYDVPEKVPS